LILFDALAAPGAPPTAWSAGSVTGMDDSEEAHEAIEGHNVYMSRQVVDIFIALKTCAGNSHYVPSTTYDAEAPMSHATFNRVPLPGSRAGKEGRVAAGAIHCPRSS